MAVDSGKWSAKKWADMDDDTDSECGFSALGAPKPPSNCSAKETDETCSTSDMAPLDCFSDDETVQEAGFEQTANHLWSSTPMKTQHCGQNSFPILSSTPIQMQQPQLLATTPVKNPELQVLDLSRSLLISRSSWLNSIQSAAPEAGSFHRRKMSHRPITADEIARSKVKPAAEDISRTKPWSSPINGCVCNTGLEERTDDVQNRSQPKIDEPLEQEKRANKPSKFKRDRYKALVEQLQQKIDADPSIEIESLLPYWPSFITSYDKLQGKLMARLQQHREKQQRGSGYTCGDNVNKVTQMNKVNTAVIHAHA